MQYNRFNLQFFSWYLLLLLYLLPSILWADKLPHQYTIGFSQATTTEPWRLLFNKLLREEAMQYPEIKLIIRNANDVITTQIQHMEEFIERKVNVILISPKVSKALTAVVNKAYDSGIAVIVLDRDIDNDRYTQFIGGDNRLIGRAAGKYAIKLLGGPGKAKGKIVEIWGGMNSTPAVDRHQGFVEVIQQESAITLYNPPQDGDWKQDKAYLIMLEKLEQYQQIDLVYAHNDPMAYGAYLAAKDLGREKNIAFLGIDAMPSEGVRWVNNNILTASFVYQTPGAEGIRQAMKLLKGETIAKRIILPTLVVDHLNAEEILLKNKLPVVK